MEPPQGDEPSPSPAPPSRIQRFIAALLLVGLLALASVWAYNAISTNLAHRWDAAQARDAETGVLDGAEPIVLGPADAQTAVVLVHGFIGASTNFGDLPNALARAGFRVHALRLPGNGTTPFDLIHTSGDDMLNEVLAELRRLKKEHARVVIVGHSMGGAISTLAAAEEPVDGLVLAAPYYRVTHQWYFLLRPETWSRLTEWAVRWTYKGDSFIRVARREAKDDIVSYRWIPSEATRAAGGLAQHARSAETLAKITSPVLMLHSPEDFAASPDAAEAALEIMASSDKTLLWLENSDHHLFWDHDREEAVAAILDFLAARVAP